MEDESNTSVEETALSNDAAIDLIAATLDMPEASDSSEQAEDIVDQDASDETDVEAPEAEEQYFDIDGEQVALSELRNGYLRHATFTKKSQELAEQRKVYEAAQFDKHQLRMEALEGIQALKQEMRIQFEQLEQPNWDQLLQEDPHTYLLEQQKWQRREASVRQMYEAEMALRKQAEAYEAEVHQAAIKELQARFMEKYPEMRDASVAQKNLGEMTNLLVDFGFSEEEIKGVADWRIIGVLYELNKLMKTQKAIPDVVQKMEQKPVISQKNSSAKASDAYTRDFNKFNKSRNGNDAIALISRLL